MVLINQAGAQLVAVHPDGSGTCTWTIWANSELWSGEGHVPAYHNDMYSGLAEAYRMYMALSFFHQYCVYHPVIMKTPRTIHIYCNNKGVLDHVGENQKVHTLEMQFMMTAQCMQNYRTQ